MKIREEINLLIQFEDGIDISELNLIMASYQRLMQRAYLAYHGQTRITRVPKQKFNASVNVRSGSIDFGFIVSAYQAAQYLSLRGKI